MANVFLSQPGVAHPSAIAGAKAFYWSNAPGYSASVLAYGNLLIANGGTNIFTNGQAQNFQDFVTSAGYIAAGSPDFVSMRSTQNMGTGASAFSFLGVECPLSNVPVWETVGLTFTNADNSFMTWPLGTVPQPFTNLFVYHYDVVPVVSNQDITIGSTSGFGGIIFDLVGYNIFDGASPTAGGVQDTDFHFFARVSDSPSSSLIEDGVVIVGPADSGAASLEDVRINGCGALGRASNITSPFIMHFPSNATALSEGIRAAYKATLGQGLSLA